jgi:pimeloyl-ACP methyl ester carboxylesterase
MSPPFPALHFAPANGFPAPCYRKLFAFLSDQFRIEYLACPGHDSRFPVTDGWRFLVQEQIDFIERHYDGPVLAVGHSLGGFLAFLAASHRPELFRAVILLDAPLIGPFRGSALQFVKRIGLIDRVTPAGSTRNRRREWPSAKDALAHFRRKRLFRDFDPECLADYVRSGTRPGTRGVELVFDPRIEYEIYRTIPHDVAGSAPSLTVPGGFIGGRNSTVVKRAGLAFTRKLLRVSIIEGGHLFPFQLPRLAAQAVRSMACQLVNL